MDMNTGQLTPLERRLQAWPFGKKLLAILACFALLGLAVGIIEGAADLAAWAADLWRM